MRSLSLRLAAVPALALLGLPASIARGQEAWSQSATERPLAGTQVRETVWTTSRPGGGAMDRISVHRYRGAGTATATLLYLPGTNMNGIAALTDEDHSLWVFLAMRGVEVFALDYRTRAVPVSATPEELKHLRGWTLEAFVGDIRAASELARRESGRPRVFVAGFSRGVSLAYAYACSDPEAVAGLIMLDGVFKNYAAKNAYDYAAELAKLEAAGNWAADVSGRLGWEKRQQLMETVAANPAAPATDAKFPTLGEQLANLLHFAWRPGGLANPLGGFSRPATLARLLAGYDRYYPTIQDVEGRSLADRDDDPRTPIDDLWGELRTPVLSFNSSGMGGDWLLSGLYSAEKSGSPDVTLNLLERYGHLDVLVGETARRDVYEPVLEWLRVRATR
jgi:hypothetical protein